MIRLPHPYYSPVYFKDEEISFDYIDPDYLSDLKLNASYVAFTKSKIKDDRFHSNEERLQEFEASRFFTQDTPLSELGLKVSLPEDSILNAAQAESYYSQPWLVTDRYFYPFGHRHVGSSRHALLYSCQLKGIGRNSLAHRGDSTHSWGGYTFMMGMNSLISNIYVDACSPLKTLPIWALARYKRLSAPGSLGSPTVMFRDARGYRLAHFEPGSPKLGEVQKVIREDLESRIGESDLTKIKQKLLGQYIAYLKNGINPRAALIPENILFDGRAIDTDEYDIHLTSAPVVTVAVRLDEFSKEEFLNLTPQKAADYMLTHECTICGDSMARNFGAWKLHTSILDELYGVEKNFEANQEMYLAGMKGELSAVIYTLLETFIEKNPTSLNPMLPAMKLSEEVRGLLKSMHLISGEYAMKEQKQAYYLSFSSDAKAQRWSDLGNKIMQIYSHELSDSKDPNQATTAFQSLRSNLLRQIKQKRA